MTSTDTISEERPTTRPHRTILRVVSVAFVGTIAAVSSSRCGTTSRARRHTRSPAPAAVASTNPAVAELADERPDGVPMTPDAAEQWLADERDVGVPMTPDAAEQWLADD